jgi:hypothetical protein
MTDPCVPPHFRVHDATTTQEELAALIAVLLVRLAAPPAVPAQRGLGRRLPPAARQRQRERRTGGTGPRSWRWGTVAPAGPPA